MESNYLIGPLHTSYNSMKQISKSCFQGTILNALFVVQCHGAHAVESIMFAIIEKKGHFGWKEQIEARLKTLCWISAVLINIIIIIIDGRWELW